MDEFHLKRMYRSPNGTLRNILGGTINTVARHYRQHQQGSETSTDRIARIFA
jgi:isocitrate dehydrogenase